MMKLSVIMPVYSEKESVTEITDWLRKNIVEDLYEIIIILSPKSDDESKRICAKLESVDLAKVFMQEVNPGVGMAYREGFARVSGTHTLMLDSDGEMGLDAIPKMISAFSNRDCDMVVGSRWIKGGGAIGYPLVKYYYNMLFQKFFRLLFQTRIHDLSLGFKMMKTSLVKGIVWESRYQEIGAETTLKPIRLDYKVCEVPATWTCRRYGKSKNNLKNCLRYPLLAFKILFTKN